MKRYLLVLFLPLLCFGFFLPTSTQAVELDDAFQQTTHIAEDLLNAFVKTADTLKWTVKTTFQERVVMRDNLSVEGFGFFEGVLNVRNLVKARGLEVARDARIGSSRFDDLWIESKIRRSGGAVIIADDLAVTGNLSLKDGSIADEDLADNYQPEYVKTIVVSPVGTPEANGTYLRSILLSITDASASNRYLVKIEPGIYDNSNNSPIAMVPYVDVEGSGQSATMIAGNSASGGVIAGAANVEMRNLQITASNIGAALVGLALDAGDDMTLRDVSINASGGVGTMTGIKCADGDAMLKNVSIGVDATGGTHATGISMEGCNIDMDGLDIQADSGDTDNIGIQTDSTMMMYRSLITTSGGVNTYGIYVTGPADLSINHSEISATGGSSTSVGIAAGLLTTINHSIIGGEDVAIGSGGTTFVGASQLAGGATGAGSFQCVATWDESGVELDSSCGTAG